MAEVIYSVNVDKARPIIHEGDTVRATVYNGAMVQGVATISGNRACIYLGFDLEAPLHDCESWEIISRAVEVPTEPGVYALLPNGAQLTIYSELFHLAADGYWSTLVGEEFEQYGPIQMAGFIRAGKGTTSLRRLIVADDD